MSKFKCKSDAQKRAIRVYYAKKNAAIKEQKQREREELERKKSRWRRQKAYALDFPNELAADRLDGYESDFMSDYFPEAYEWWD